MTIIIKKQKVFLKNRSHSQDNQRSGRYSPGQNWTSNKHKRSGSKEYYKGNNRNGNQQRNTRCGIEIITKPDQEAKTITNTDLKVEIIMNTDQEAETITEESTEMEHTWPA